MKHLNQFCLWPLLVLITIGVVNTYAQKLPNKQEAGVYAPANIKIDGKADEWIDKFQAYNHATDLFYTLANNDEFIYLIMHAENPNVIETIATYGLTFSIQPQGKNKDKENVIIQFPVFEPHDGMPRYALYMTGVTIDTSARVEEGVMNSNNKMLHQKHKKIVVNGIAGLDTLSMYNDVGIKIVEAFDSKRHYTLEMAVPLKYFRFLKTENSKLAYHVLVNGYVDKGINAPNWYQRVFNSLHSSKLSASGFSNFAGTTNPPISIVQ